MPELRYRTIRGWAEGTHALNWLNNVFEKETSPPGRPERGQRRDRSQKRLLLVDSQFPMTPEFCVTCWERNVICLCVPRKGAEYLNPCKNGIFDALNKLYTEHMKKQLRHKSPHTISPSQFAAFIDLELGFPDRETESTEAWSNSCLFPPSPSRLMERRRGDRIRSQTFEPNGPIRARRRHISPDESNDVEQTTADNNAEEGDNVIAVIVPQEQEVPEEPEVPANPTDTEHNPEQSESEQSSSEEENSNAHVPITPSRTRSGQKPPNQSRPANQSYQAL
ncbi:hypothetical protein PENNAL_c0026G05382 [Penicillium nalgiovense]|uniref:DDE-1 domain-containing protein n=1 Tax=Penicillium nalgiovense TaxID=60175 RepID=A0A1V6YBL2_PENNA|nr:hypothetical protein PENNAL_c0026G05382 [Penicillium nalgiovense]